ncbi:MAG: hypothetical protein OEZ02_13560 [Anaerolineae bacterium]|nr:hypothetical protein [Anaerolineae bacterium]
MKPKTMFFVVQMLLSVLLLIAMSASAASPAQASQAPAPVLAPGSGSWEAVGSGTNDSVWDMAIDNTGMLYAVGKFTDAGVGYTKYIAKWDGASWSAVGTGVTDNSVYEVEVDRDNNVYIGGAFRGAGSMVYNKNFIAKWDGSTWSSMKNGMDGFVTALGVSRSGKVYAGGFFSKAGSTYVNNIATWGSGNWWPLGSGVNSAVNSIIVNGAGKVFAGGNFSKAGGKTVNYIAKWNGSEWSAVGGGMNAQIIALAFDSNGNLYAGGAFTTAGGNNAKHIAKWNGKTWRRLGTGMNGNVSAIAVDIDGNVYAGGTFTTAGGKPINNIAVWNGSEWSAVGGGMNGSVAALTLDTTGNLYAGGVFTTAGGITANHIAKWNTGNIFIDGFENGKLNAWSSKTGVSMRGDYNQFGTAAALCKLCVLPKAAKIGRYGLQVRALDNLPHFLTDTSPAAETTYNARVYLKLKPLIMGDLNEIKLFQARDGTKPVVQILVRKKGLYFQIKAITKLDNGNNMGTKWHIVPQRWVPVEVNWQAATSSGTDDGYLKLFVGRKLKQHLEFLDNDTLAIKSVRLGITSYLNATDNISNFFYLDNFISNNSYRIGP